MAQTQATTIEQLQDQATELRQRVEAKQAEQGGIAAAWKDLITSIVDAGDKERPALLKQRAALATERDTIGDELAVLKRRRDVADLAVFLFAESQAAHVAEVTHVAETAARVARDNALDERQRRHNSGSREAATAESDAVLVGLEIRVAKTQAELNIAARDHSGANQLLQKSRYDVDAETTRQAAQVA